MFFPPLHKNCMDKWNTTGTSALERNSPANKPTLGGTG